MQFYKGRTVEIGQRVDCYRNLHHGGYSLRCAKSGKVLAHCDNAYLKNVEFKVSESGRIKTLVERRKRVHGFIRGEFVGADIPQPGHLTNGLVYYNPYNTKQFMDLSKINSSFNEMLSDIQILKDNYDSTNKVVLQQLDNELQQVFQKHNVSPIHTASEVFCMGKVAFIPALDNATLFDL